jgi:glutaredoxin 3
MAKIEIYTKNYCPFCHKALELLKSLDVEFENIDVTDTPEVVSEKLTPISGSSTVPQLFVDGKYIGGCDDMHKLHEEDKLMSILNAA